MENTNHPEGTMTSTTDLTAQYAAWDAPFLADPRDEAAMAARGEQTRALAAAILAAKVGTKVGPVGPLVKNTGGWSAETAAKADATAPAGSAEWCAALGDPEHTANVFVYAGPHGDPDMDRSQHYYDLPAEYGRTSR